MEKDRRESSEEEEVGGDVDEKEYGGGEAGELGWRKGRGEEGKKDLGEYKSV